MNLTDVTREDARRRRKVWQAAEIARCSPEVAERCADLIESADYMDSRGTWPTDFAAHVIDLALIEIKRGRVAEGERRIDVFNRWAVEQYEQRDRDMARVAA